MMKLLTAATALTILLAGCLGEWPPELYLVPEGYIGPVVVAFEQEDGVAPTMSGDTLVYRVPQSGVLKTSTEVPTGIRDVSYAFVDESGMRSPLPDDNPNVNVPERTVQVFGIIEGYLGELVEPPGDTLCVEGAMHTDKRSPSVRFLVGRRTDRDSLWAARDSLERSITVTQISGEC